MGLKDICSSFLLYHEPNCLEESYNNTIDETLINCPFCGSINTPKVGLDRNKFISCYTHPPLPYILSKFWIGEQFNDVHFECIKCSKCSNYFHIEYLPYNAYQNGHLHYSYYLNRGLGIVSEANNKPLIETIFEGWGNLFKPFKNLNSRIFQYSNNKNVNKNYSIMFLLIFLLILIPCLYAIGIYVLSGSTLPYLINAIFLFVLTMLTLWWLNKYYFKIKHTLYLDNLPLQIDGKYKNNNWYKVYSESVIKGLISGHPKSTIPYSTKVILYSATLIMVILLIIGAISIYIQTHNLLFDSIAILFLSPVIISFGIFFGVIAFAFNYYTLTIVTIWLLSSPNPLNINAFEESAGLKIFSDLILSSISFITKISLILLILSFIGIISPMLAHNSNTNVDAVNLYSAVLLSIVIIILIIFTTALCIIPLHHKLKTYKTLKLKEYSNLINKHADDAENGKSSDVILLLKKKEIVNSMSTWPFNSSTITSFAKTVFLIITSLIIPIITVLIDILTSLNLKI